MECLKAKKKDIFRIYCEQTSHHPPISNFLIESEAVQIYGHYELSGSPSGNSYNIANKGVCRVKFKDSSQVIKFELPKVSMSGILWGSSTLSIQGSLQLIDECNSLKAHVTFGEKKGGSGGAD